ncbi:MarR family transcriptional regulator [Pikeienuella piscinae]|uniref:MarR family transcriptional regulator n=1 Tax=Pikeienuella piscinae TaxID=2748098 RepID=A0A7L5BZ44_9RHOB|nr:MarR family transcriptional regulator [Pikeienuella piscinae]QIE56098.1 MarR family transcriptional regulator [Pikeienuella piscinae]
MTSDATADQTQTTPRYRLDKQVGFLLRLANQRHTAIFQQNALRELTPTQFAALMRIAEIGPVSQNQLGRMTAMDVATIKGVVERLRRKGLVRSGPDPIDRRRTRIALSESAEALLDDLRDMGRRITEETLAPLSPTDRRVFLALLARMI